MASNDEIMHMLRRIDRRLSELERKVQADSDREVDTAAACRILGKSRGAVNKMAQRGLLNARKSPNGRLRFKESELRSYYNNN